ncbi:tRNA adenosine(34) deaminase TadA [Shewanella sp. NIFS-20-20]|uniref:tRNA adenosine(34) deaminase TadA n=1 Tax=Shewanella sp. NIFS-20-20 TaxID=2853806 RepID=UPI001C4369FD|nr:tRNA adenosine(34) deaminase TadA [Shewanella sp. NIFS-20-20]MBV7317141.1 tRNA adenosine(34) deaminase TadA [Shewanella sp. NIFS-20-20]
MDQSQQDQQWMRVALDIAKRAELRGEIPVGAVLVKDGQLVASGYNLSITLNDASAHAEIQCLRAAGQVLDNYRLIDTTLYVTLEPCSMCAGAMVHARVGRVVFGAHDAKTGAAGSQVNLVQHPNFNHQLQVTSGVLAAECSAQLSAFFQRRRREKKAEKLLRTHTINPDSAGN